MEHVAIMKKSWGLTQKILSGEKKIESRWYQTKRAPWGKIKIGDSVFFKDTGEPVIAKATVSDIIQLEVKNINEAKRIVKLYGKDICLINSNPMSWGKLAKYCILIFLKNPVKIKPFEINKKGFGAMSAWITVDNVSKIKK